MTGHSNARGSVCAAAALALAAALLISGCETPPSEVPTAETIRGLKPTAKVTLTEAFISGTGVGAGTLTFRGKAYPFTLTGELIGLGAVATLQASGEVYGLRDLSQFSGAYVQGTRRLALSVSGTGDLWLRNNHGVVMRLVAAQTGLTLSAGRSQIFVELAR